MSLQWAKDEAKLGFSGPPGELGWADHEEVVEGLKAKADQMEFNLRQLLSKVSCEAALAIGGNESYELAIERIARFCKEIEV